MTYEIIENLVEKLSCNFVLAAPEDPGSLSGLLPILKQIHGKCMKMSFDNPAKEVLKARKIINSIIRKDPRDIDDKMLALDELISGLSSSVYASKEHDKTSNNNYTPGFGRIEKSLNEFSVLIGRFCPEEIPDLGAMLNALDELIEASKKKDFAMFHEISIACKTYVENMTLENIHNTKPIDEVLLLLKSILVHLKKQEAFVFDYSDVMELLDISFKEGQNLKGTVPKPEEPESDLEKKPEKISDEDMEILVDFISEAYENLDAIEVNLIDLEQDPSNKDIINDIFRPFHTIKGVSGFLSLTKINKLAHTTENLLDSARSGDFLINDTATDAILESVDTLKNLIASVENGTRTGFKQPDDDIDVDTLRDKLQRLQVSLSKGKKEPLGKILIKKGDISAGSLERALEIQKDHPDKKIGEILVEEKKAESGQVAMALMEQNLSAKRVASQVKVSTEKLDDLVDYAGELVIAQSMLRQKTSNNAALSQSVAQLGQIVTNMQNIAMSMRMIPIKATFMKMIRLVRDLSRKSGKKVDLNMVGEDTEIDRNVVDALYEPMVHMIRNSVDHGIEVESKRLEQKKPSSGNIVLRAYHKGGHIIIEIEDDGKGLDKDRILEKAKSTGLISGSENMTDAQIYDLILHPGFSTAKEITDVSGRGVGMDVVKNGIEKFRGHLNIESSKGKGSKFTISLPLTLAIIDGMLVGVDDEKYVIPTIAIQKAFKPDKKDCFTVEGKGEMVKDRGGLIPVIRLNEIYGSSNREKAIFENLVVVVESKEEKRALLIDELLGKDEYVIKSLGSNLEDVKGLAGGAILSDGRVGLILDIHGIFEVADG
ncbi:MAG: chemotaxis protein CheA [Deltaproteobacteria bacterium]|nr:chemotaxis protein CheA [Deltaproteobacteria bacterium]